MKFSHQPILLEECVEALNVQPGGIYVDCTAGGGGHSARILQGLSEQGLLIDVDRDVEALQACKERLAGKNNVRFVHSDYKAFDEILSDLSVDSVDGVMIDLGISSYQIDNPDRGFSYMAANAPLDMRMDQSASLSAKDVVNGYDERTLAEILRDYGEEDFARKIAAEIVKARAKAPIETCGRLVEIVDGCIPMAVKRKIGHPAKKTFQAIRIEVNKELDGLDEALRKMVASLKVGGRLVVLTFHSLEDRIVKRCFNDLATDCICPPNVPVCVCDHRASVKLVNKKPILPSEEEMKRNKRSQSAKLRIVEKILS